MTKKRKNILSIISLSLLASIALCSAVHFALRFTNRSSVEVSSSPVDNSYNNRILNYENLFQIEDKLYYSYDSGDFRHCGTYEISNHGSYKFKGVNFDTYDPASIFDRILYPQSENIFEHNGEILIQPDFENVDKLKGYSSVLKIKNNYCNVGTTIDDELVYTVDEYNDNLYFFTQKAVYRYDEDNKKDKFNKVIDIPEELSDSINYTLDIHLYYFDNDTLYILYPNEKTYDFYALGLNGKDKKVYHTTLSTTRNIYSLVVDDNYAILGSCGNGVTTNSYIYTIDLENNCTIDYVAKHLCDFNYYNGKVYAYTGYDYTNKGIHIIDVKDKSSKQIYDDNVYAVYVLDNEWVYFSDNYSTLYRVSVDGSKLETVFDAPYLMEKYS